MEAPDDFSCEDVPAGTADPQVQAWEQLMWKFQRALPWAAPGQKWVPMQRVFSLGAL